MFRRPPAVAPRAWGCLLSPQATLEQTADWALLPRLKRSHAKAVADVSHRVLPAMLDRLDHPEK
jgi:hypothetical protein